MLRRTKNTILYVILMVVGSLISSCRPTPQYPEVLLLADSLTQCNADSAVRLLQELAPTMSQAQEPVRRYHQLLTIKAQDKAFITHTSDSLILDVLRYYQEEGDPCLLPEAYYYAGRVTRDLGDAPQALDYFHHTLDVMQTRDNQSRMQGQEERTLNLQGKIYAQMSYLFHRQNLYNEAIMAMEQAYKVDSLNRDTTGMILCLRDLGDIHRSHRDYDESLSYYDEAESLSINMNNTKLRQTITLQKAYVYNKLGDSFSAKKIIEADSFSLNRSNLVSVCSILAKIYSDNEEYGIAAQYYSRLLTCNNISAQSSANLWLGNRAVIEGKPDSALMYFRTYMQYEDSLNNLKDTEAVALSQSIYNYQLREKDIHKLQIKEFRYMTYVWMSIVITVILFALLYIEHTRRKKVKQQYELLQGIIAASKMDAKHKEIMSQAAMNKLRRDDIYTQLTELCKERTPLKKEEWPVVEKTLSLYFPDFISKLRAIHNYNETEWELSILLKMGFSWLEIASLIGRSYTAVYSSQARLLIKIFPKGSDYNNWLDFISAL